jgi:hypothetical protein
MKTILLACVTFLTLGFTVPSAEARDGDRHKRYYSKSHRHYHNRDRVRVVYRNDPRYYYSSDYGYRYPYRVYPRRTYYRPSGLSLFFRF